MINRHIQRSRARLERLGYFSSVDIRTRPVLGENDLVDLIVTVEEGKTPPIEFGGGYGEGTGFFLEFYSARRTFGSRY